MTSVDHHHVLNLRRMARKRGPGRPSFGIKEVSHTMWIPEELRDAMKARAEKEGITAAEAWRRAAREWLGLKPDAYSKRVDELLAKNEGK